MICDEKAVGIVSYGVEDCGAHPAVYARLVPYLEWIEKQTSENPLLVFFQDFFYYIIGFGLTILTVFSYFLYKKFRPGYKMLSAST